MNYWLFKTEPGCFSFNDLKKGPDMTGHWDGVRNFQARNFLRDSVKLGDQGESSSGKHAPGQPQPPLHSAGEGGGVADDYGDGWL